MKPLFVLLFVFLICCGINYLLFEDVMLSNSGTIAMSVMLLFTALGHYKFTEGMVLMMPDNFGEDYKRKIVLASGDLEIAMAAGLLIPEISKVTAILTMLFFLAIVPANIIGAIKKVHIERANYTGHGLHYLWFRLPLQVFFMAWVYYFGAMIA